MPSHKCAMAIFD